MAVIVPETGQEHPPWWRDHCLLGCVGFLVEGATGTVGFVEQVVCEGNRPVALVVQASAAAGARRLRLLIDDVDEVRPESERVVLRRGTRLAEESERREW